MTPHRLLSFAVTAALALSACSPSSAPPATGDSAEAPVAVAAAVADPAYLAEVEQWRQERERKLREPDGWLSFTGSGQVAPGEHRVGSAADNAIVVPGGPARWGVLRLGKDGALSFEAAGDAALTVAGKPLRATPLRTQLDDGGPTSIHAGAQRFYVVKTGDVYGWRFRDANAPALQAFAGVPHFAVDPAWRIEADWQPFAQPQTLELVTSNGTVDPARVPGRAEFERDGRRFTLLPVQEKDGDELFFIIADRTSGKSTYGGGRFLYAQPARNGKVVLDLNKAVNPPCALNGHVVCPTAPPENRLDLQVEAGEKTFPKSVADAAHG